MARFDYFVIFAEMRTGSNHLQESLAAIPGLSLHGEAFNPMFIGGPKMETLFDQTLAQREDDPHPLLDALIREGEGLPGFRFFHDHDPRILARILPDPRCAKIILTRNPLESYVSRKIAAETGQWRLTNAKMAKSAQVDFDPADFDAMLAAQQEFQRVLLRGLQTSGQTAFYLNYEDIGDREVINGIAAFLGVEGRLLELPGRIKRQNPGAIQDKLTNPEVMTAHLENLDPFQLAQTPNFEPPRGPFIPQIYAAAQSPLLFLPVPGGPTDEVTRWMERLDGAPPIQGFSQKTLRPWMRQAGQHCAFSVVRHPLLRAHHVFCSAILPRGTPGYAETRRAIIQQYGVPIPRPGPDADYSKEAHYAGFLGFLGFLKALLNGSSALKMHGGMASQLVVIQGIGQVLPPHRILREADLEAQVTDLADAVSQPPAPILPSEDDMPFGLGEIYSQELEDAAFDAYRKDYLTFGFTAWQRSEPSKAP